MVLKRKGYGMVSRGGGGFRTTWNPAGSALDLLGDIVALDISSVIIVFRCEN